MTQRRALETDGTIYRTRVSFTRTSQHMEWRLNHTRVVVRGLMNPTAPPLKAESRISLSVYINIFCKRGIYHSHCAIADFRSDELSSVNSFHECKLCRSQMSEQSLLVYRVYSVNIHSMYEV
jgi:hypothetical protein